MSSSCEELTQWKRPWCWDGLRVGGEGDDSVWDGWMAPKKGNECSNYHTIALISHANKVMLKILQARLHIDGSPPGSPVPGILQARTLEWVAISSSNACKWKVKIESEVRSVVSDSSRPHGLQPTRLLRPWDFPDKSTGVGCHLLLWLSTLVIMKRCIGIIALFFHFYLQWLQKLVV